MPPEDYDKHIASFTAHSADGRVFQIEAHQRIHLMECGCYAPPQIIQHAGVIELATDDGDNLVQWLSVGRYTIIPLSGMALGDLDEIDVTSSDPLAI